MFLIISLMINSAIFFFFFSVSFQNSWYLDVGCPTVFFVCFVFLFVSILLQIIWRNSSPSFLFYFFHLCYPVFHFQGPFFNFLNLPFIPPCSGFMDVVSVLIFAWCKNHIIYVSFPYVVSASSHSLVCLSWSVIHSRAFFQMSSKPCLTEA